MIDQKTILVTGATGAQGGSVARHLLKDNQFAVRCLTRNVNSDGATDFKQLGVEVVQGDLDEINSLQAAMEGCYGVFGVTNFWEHFEKEYQQGKNLVDAVAASDVQHFVFSTLPSAKKISNGALEVPHFDIKGQLEDYARDRNLNATFIHIAFYYENFLSFFPPQKQADGTYSFGFPQGDTPLAAVSVEDLGGVVAGVFNNPDEYKGKVVGVVGEDVPPSRYAEIMTRVLEQTIVYQYIPQEVFASFGFPGADDLANMFEFNRLYIPNRQEDLLESRKLYPQVQTFESWVNKNKDKFQPILQG